MKTTYALLVGINTYPPPIPELGGCIKDLDQIEGFLRGVAGQGVETVDTINGLPRGGDGGERPASPVNQTVDAILDLAVSVPAMKKLGEAVGMNLDGLGSGDGKK